MCIRAIARRGREEQEREKRRKEAGVETRGLWDENETARSCFVTFGIFRARLSISFSLSSSLLSRSWLKLFACCTSRLRYLVGTYESVELATCIDEEKKMPFSYSFTPRSNIILR